MSAGGVPIIDTPSWNHDPHGKASNFKTGLDMSARQPQQRMQSPIGEGVFENGVVNLMPGVIGGGLTYNPETQQYMKYDGLLPGYSVTQEQAYQALHPSPDYSQMSPDVLAHDWSMGRGNYPYIPQQRQYSDPRSYREFRLQPQVQQQVGPDYAALIRPQMRPRMPFRSQMQRVPMTQQQTAMPQQPFNPFRITSRSPR